MLNFTEQHGSEVKQVPQPVVIVKCLEEFVEYFLNIRGVSSEIWSGWRKRLSQDYP